jgi:hypothetical protein
MYVLHVAQRAGLGSHSRLMKFALASRQLHFPIPVKRVDDAITCRCYRHRSRAHCFLVLANFSCHLRADGFIAATALSPLEDVAAVLLAFIVVSDGKS